MRVSGLPKPKRIFLSAQREYRARNYPNDDAACFFFQQCIEKYLKSRLAEAGQRPFPRLSRGRLAVPGPVPFSPAPPLPVVTRLWSESLHRHSQ